tara:strand:- start:91842 stop:92618 length:777 start_codon:yes stop_codon:yes gene_type:complete
MEINFFKYQGTGNDFVMVDNRKSDILLDQNQIKFLCDRRFGIGADGFILLEEVEAYDFKMVYYNSDGRESTMCGNGGRCISQFAHDLGINKEELNFLAIDGAHKAKLVAEEISLQMIDVSDLEKINNDIFLNTGSPHHVVFLNEIDEFELVEEARKIRYSDHYKKEGVNVNFVKVENEAFIKMRTYERGVEDETLSCGTGVTAAVLAAFNQGLISSNNVKVETQGGLLSLSFKGEGSPYSEIFLQGPAQFVFEGKISL